MDNERDVLNAAVMAGTILLQSGAEIFRVEETMARITKAYGVDSGSSFVLSSGIFITAGNEKEEYFAKVRHIPLSASRLDKVAAVNQLSREIEAGCYTLGQAVAKLQEISDLPQRKPVYRILASGIGSGCFCHLFGGDAADCFCALLAGLVLYTYIIFVSSRKLSKIVGNISCGALVTILSVLLYTLNVGNHLNQMIIGSIIPLVPGVSFTSAIRDIADGDYLSGSIRMLDALLVAFCVAIGVGLVFILYNRLTGGGML